MTQPTFLQRCRSEWHRLNPRYVRDNDDVRTVFVAASRETLWGYFAPLRFLFWLASHSWRQR